MFEPFLEHPGADPEKLRGIYRGTEIRRSPLTGIVEGYHTLPFLLIGPEDAGAPSAAGSMKLTGEISVSPKLVIPLSPGDDRFADIFPEDEPFMDRSLVSRVFSFARSGKNLRVRNRHLRVEPRAEPARELLEQVLDGMDRAEIVDTGVIWCPEPRFYPVSLERFIVSVLDREFR